MSLRQDILSTGTRADAKVASAFKMYGVPYLFGIPGGGSSIDLIEACRREDIPFVLTQHETSAAIMALVCGKLTGSCGVCVSIMGPGATAVAGGASYAYWERHPLLCLTECYGSAQAPLMSLQKMDHAQMFTTFCKASSKLDAIDPGRQIGEAMELAAAERPGPVHMDLPIDVTSRVGPGPTHPARADVAAPAVPLSGDLDAVADALEKANKPLIIAGPAVHRQGAERQLLELAEKLQLAVLVTSKARGVIPENHPLFAGVVTGYYGRDTLEGKIVHQSDLILAVGLDRMELLTPWGYPQPLIALDAIEVPEDETVGRPSVKATGPLPELLESLTLGLRTRRCWDAAALEAFWSDTLVSLGAMETGLNSASLLRRARQMAPKDTILTTETGIYNAVNLFVWKVFDSMTYFGSCGANTMGFCLPAALAASLVRPAQKTVAFVGDGGFLMRAPELETAARLKLSPVIIIFNDGTLGLIRVKQQAKEYSRVGVDLTPTDFVKLAESFGGQGWEVRTLREFEGAFNRALSSDRLSVIDARLDPDTYASHLRQIRGN